MNLPAGRHYASGVEVVAYHELPGRPAFKLALQVVAQRQVNVLSRLRLYVLQHVALAVPAIESAPAAQQPFRGVFNAGYPCRFVSVIPAKFVIGERIVLNVLSIDGLGPSQQVPGRPVHACFARVAWPRASLTSTPSPLGILVHFCQGCNFEARALLHFKRNCPESIWDSGQPMT